MAKGGESKQGLIITLVLAFLIIVGLGVSTYFGFAEQTELTKKASDAAKAKNAIAKERDWHKFKELLFKAYAGHTSKEDMAELTTRRGEWDRGQIGVGEKDRAEIEGIIKKLDAQPKEGGLGWDLGQGRPATNYAEVVAALRTEVGNLHKEVAKAKLDADEAGKARDRAENIAQTARNDYLKKLQDVQTALLNLQNQKQNEFLAARKELEELSKRLEETEKKAAAQVDDRDKKLESLLKEKDKLEIQVGRLAQEKGELEKEFARVRGLVEPVNALESGVAKGKLVRLDRSGNTAWINLGSADQLKPQVRFSIFKDKGNGTATGELKGTLQVTEVGERMSRAQVTFVRDPNREPLLVGDLLYNPAWSPGMRERVAIAGVVDPTGRAGDSLLEQQRALEEFIRTLEKQGLIVDAYLDLREIAAKGKGMNYQTSYLILGERPDQGVEGNVRPDTAKFETVQKLSIEMGKMQDEARKLGITIIPLKKFLTLTGYRVPRQANGNGAVKDYSQRFNQPAPVENKDAPKKEKEKVPAPKEGDGK